MDEQFLKSPEFLKAAPVATRDETMPPGRWTFDGDVTDAFDDMLARSIPQYDLMRETVFSLGSEFVQHKTDVVDLGCSRGEALDPFVRKFGAWNRFIGLDVSDPMLAVAKARFEGYIRSGVVDIIKHDLRYGYPSVSASLTLAILTLQFVPIEHRQRVVQDIYNRTLPGGAFVLVEKVLGESSRLDALFVKRYYQMKSENGYSQDAIERKRLSLEGVLVPVTARWNVELLRQAGFRQIDAFWRWSNFGGWIAIRD